MSAKERSIKLILLSLTLGFAGAVMADIPAPVGNLDGTWTAAFEKPTASGTTAAFYQLCIGD